MKNFFNRLSRHHRNLKKVVCQIGLAQEELKETNEKLEDQK